MSLLYRVYQKKVSRSLFNIQKSLLCSWKDEAFWIVTIFVKFEEKLIKYESNENNRSKSHIFTSEQKKMTLIIYLSRETVNVA